jgi:hypothetical protein
MGSSSERLGERGKCRLANGRSRPPGATRSFKDSEVPASIESDGSEKPLTLEGDSFVMREAFSFFWRLVLSVKSEDEHFHATFNQ